MCVIECTLGDGRENPELYRLLIMILTPNKPLQIYVEVSFPLCPVVAEPETKACQESAAQSAALAETTTAFAGGVLAGLRIAVCAGYSCR